MSATVIGGPFKCLIHDIETDDVNEWNEHCIETKHTETGTTQCTNCGTGISFENIPFQRITPTGKNIQLRCEKCFNEGEDLNRLVNKQQQQQSGQEQQPVSLKGRGTTTGRKSQK